MYKKHPLGLKTMDILILLYFLIALYSKQLILLFDNQWLSKNKINCLEYKVIKKYNKIKMSIVFKPKGCFHFTHSWMASLVNPLA